MKYVKILSLYIIAAPIKANTGRYKNSTANLNFALRVLPPLPLYSDDDGDDGVDGEELEQKDLYFNASSFLRDGFVFELELDELYLMVRFG